MPIRPARQIGSEIPSERTVNTVARQPLAGTQEYRLVDENELREMLEEQAADLSINQPDDISDAVAALDGAIT